MNGIGIRPGDTVCWKKLVKSNTDTQCSSYSSVDLRAQLHHLEHQIAQLKEEKNGHIKSIYRLKQQLKEEQRKAEHQEMWEFHQSGMIKAQEDELDRLWAAQRDVRFDASLLWQHFETPKWSFWEAGGGDFSSCPRLAWVSVD